MLSKEQVYMQGYCAAIARGDNREDANRWGRWAVTDWIAEYPREDARVPGWEGHAVIDLCSRERIVGRVRTVEKWCGKLLQVEPLLGVDAYGPPEELGAKAIFRVRSVSREEALKIVAPVVEVAA